MKRFSLVITLFLTCAIAFDIFVFLAAWADRREEKTNNFNQLYSIEPKSLLDDIEQGKTDIFLPIDEDPPWPSPDQQIPVPWMQDDYLRIANALFGLVWNDNIDGWQLNDMYFNLSCTQPDIGFQSGIFTFFKNEETNGNKSRIERIVNIDPRDKTVYITENRYDPRLVDWESIALNENLLSAEEGLQIAENVGGKEKRSSVANTCYISLSLSQDVGLWNEKWWWWAHYSQWDDEGRQTTLFSVDLNPYTGELRP